MAAGKQAEIDVAYVARLARIQLADEEAARLQQDLEQIVAYVRQLEALDVTGVEPTAHATRVANVFREDVVGACLDREDVLANAPAELDGELIQVPVVIGGDEELSI